MLHYFIQLFATLQLIPSAINELSFTFYVSQFLSTLFIFVSVHFFASFLNYQNELPERCTLD